MNERPHMMVDASHCLNVMSYGLLCLLLHSSYLMTYFFAKNK